jgi:Zn ribbon nucleic-acid-binding protein
MRCPKCGDELAVLYLGTSSAVGVECVVCKTRWASARVQTIADDLREHMHRQLQGIVRYMDFGASCVEMTEKPDV